MTVDDAALALSSNGAPLAFTHELFAPMRDSSDLLGDPDALRRRFVDDGYLLLRGVLDPDSVWAVRRDYFAQFPPAVFAPASDRSDGVLDPAQAAILPPHGVAGHPAYEFVRSARFTDFVEQPPLVRLASTLLDRPPRRLPRAILRHFAGGSLRSSRAHTDYAYMDQGSDQLVTMWIPIGDCPLAMGGLIYLDGSHRMPPEHIEPVRTVTDRPADGRPISHDLGWVARQLGSRWLWADYRAGDLAVHSPHLIHAALDTTTVAARLSADVRYLASGEEADPRWMRPWSADDGA